MKKIITSLFCTTVSALSLHAQQVFTYLAEMKDGVAYYGFADSSGNTKTLGKYNLIMRPSEGICRVWAGQKTGNDYNNVVYGYCLPDGTELVSPKYVKGEEFVNGMALVQASEGFLSRKTGFINVKGEEQIPLIYLYAKSFGPNGLAPVCLEKDKWFYIDKNGTTKIPGPFLDADPFSEGLAGVSIPRDLGSGVISFSKGYIDSTGKMVIAADYNYVMPFKEGRAVVSFAGQTPKGYKNYQILIDKTGRKLTSQEYATISATASDGLYAVKISGNSGINKETDEWGVVDNKGVLQGMRYKYQPYFSEGLMPVAKDSLTGYIDKTGKMVIPPLFKKGYGFTEGMAPVMTKEGLWGYINRKGEMVIKPEFASAGFFSEGYAVVYKPRDLADKKNSLAGVIDKKGKLVIPFEARTIGQFANGKAVATTDYISYFLYPDGKTTLACAPAVLANGRYALAAIGRNDAKFAFDILNKEAGKGCPMTDYWLGYMLMQLKPPAKDSVRGAALMEQAAVKNFPEAMYSTGYTYAYGLGGKKDEVKAKEWLNKAGRSGVHAAYTLLGVMHEKADPKQAHAYYLQAAEKGDAVAMYNLALLYRDGRGVNKDIAQYNNWLNKSARKQYQPARQLLNAKG